MSSYKQNDCVGCPQGCINCGRNRDYIVWECDECSCTTTEETDFEHIGYKDYCRECYEKLMEEIETRR